MTVKCKYAILTVDLAGMDIWEVNLHSGLIAWSVVPSILHSFV